MELGKEIELGKVVEEYRPVYANDPAGLSWALFTVASGAASRLSMVVAHDLGCLEGVGSGDLAPQGPTRVALDWIARTLSTLREHH